jgi:hypothetical protein
MVFPFIPFMAAGAVAAGSVVFAWYSTLSKEDKEKANKAVEEVLKRAGSTFNSEQGRQLFYLAYKGLYGTSPIKSLTSKEVEAVKNKTVEVIKKSNDNFEIAMDIARKLRPED